MAVAVYQLTGYPGDPYFVAARPHWLRAGHSKGLVADRTQDAITGELHMAELKTKPTDVSVASFLNGIEDTQRRAECKSLAKMMKKVTGAAPKMWGPSIVGFGKFHYKYASGHEGDICIAGFAPRKAALTVYIMPGFQPFKPLMQKLGKYKTGKGCLYIKRLTDVDTGVLEELVAESVRYMKEKYPAGVR